MNTVLGLDDAERKIGKIDFDKFPVVRRLCFKEVLPDTGEYELELSVVSEGPGLSRSLDLRFDGVKSLELHHFAEGATRVLGFSINEISDRQWEGLNWEVTDFENQMLHFYCRSVTVVTASAEN